MVDLLKQYLCFFFNLYKFTFNALIASSSVTSSPAKITLMVSDQWIPKAVFKMYIAAFPLSHFTGGLASVTTPPSLLPTLKPAS